MFLDVFLLDNNSMIANLRHLLRKPRSGFCEIETL